MAAAALITVVALGPVAADAGSALAPAAAECGDIGNTDPVNDGFPNRMSALVGADMRTGGHECFERVVLELQGSGDLPGYQVRYEPDPILDSPRGEPVDIAGDATLVLSVGVWMTDIEGNGYQGPTEIVPNNVVNIRELELIENFEGQSAWAIGLDQRARLHREHAHRSGAHRDRHRPRARRRRGTDDDGGSGADDSAPGSELPATPLTRLALVLNRR